MRLTRVLVTISLVTRDVVKGGGYVYQHPVLAEALIRDRIAELRHSAGPSTAVQAEKRRIKLVAAARQGTGWLLVDMGLRLAMPRVSTKPVAPGQR